jgi:hypothetical protein
VCTTSMSMASVYVTSTSGARCVFNLSCSLLGACEASFDLSCSLLGLRPQGVCTKILRSGRE